MKVSNLNFKINDYTNEITYRILYVIGAILSMFVVSLLYRKELFNVLFANYLHFFVFHSAYAGLYATICIALYISIISTLPVVCLQIWYFFKESCYPNEAQILSYLCLSICSLFLFSLYIAQRVIVSDFLIFLLQYQLTTSNSYGLEIEYLPEIMEFVGFYVTVISWSALMHLLPICMMLLYLYNWLSLNQFVSFRKLFIFIFFIIGTLFSPPDIGSQFLIAVPLIIFYEITVCVMHIASKMDSHKKT
jgi:sec-independent protein translocase protein TatC